MATACFTGHRPNKLGGYNWNSPVNQRIFKRIEEAVRKLIEEEKVDTFIFGGALGIDQMAFSVLLDLKNSYYNYLTLIIAVPFVDQPTNWPDHSHIRRYHNQLKSADSVVYVDTLSDTKYQCLLTPVGRYHPAKMQLRNEYMVDKSDFVIAVWDGSTGGTANCVNYAGKQNKKIMVLSPQ